MGHRFYHADGFFVAAASDTAENPHVGYGSVNFDDKGLVNFADVTTQYAGDGVVFQGFLVTGAQVNLEAVDSGVFYDNTPPSPPMSLSNFYNDNQYLRADIMRLVFGSPVSGVSLDYNGAGSYGASTLFKVYDSGGVLLDTLTLAAATDSNYHLLSVPDSNVGYIDIVSPMSGWGHYIDNLTFTRSNNVPDAASTGWLLGVALVTFASIRRKLS